MTPALQNGSEIIAAVSLSLMTLYIRPPVRMYARSAWDYFDDDRQFTPPFVFF